jgi:uncharacterized protein YycO
MNKRGQFFILTAVIVATLIFSISMTVNKVNTYKNFDSIQDYSDMIDKEISTVQDYQVYNDIPDNQLEDFVEKLSVNLKDQDPNLNFVIFYGDKSSIIVKNYGENGVTIDGETIPGTNDNSGIITLQTGVLSTYTDIGGETIIINPNEETTISFSNRTYFFTLPDYNVVVFLIEKEDGDEQFVSIK